MKLPKFKKLSTKLSLYILTITTILFVVSFSLYYRFTSNKIINEALEKSTLQANNLALKIDASLSNIEETIEGFKSNIVNYIDQDVSVRQLLKYIMDSHPEICGIGVAIDPELCSEAEESAMLYASRDNQKYNFEFYSNNHRYPSENWYKNTKLNQTPSWEEPYWQLSGKDSTMVVSYCSPLYISDNEFVGVIAADLPLTWIDSLVQSTKTFENSYSYLISQKACYLSHKDQSRIFHQTFFSANAHLQDSTINALGQRMIKGESGYCEYTLDGSKRYEFFSPVEQSRWSVGIVSLKSDIISDLIATTNVLIIIILGGLILIFLLTILAIKRSTKQLKKLSASSKSIAHGNFNVEIPKINSRDEIYELRESFVNMQQSLKDYIEQLKVTTQKSERINSELSIATQIQMGMLPTLFPPHPSLTSVECFAKLIPAKEVGGDLYDFLAIGDTFYFTVGDASGKGVPASLMMTITSSLFRSSVIQLQDPSKVLHSMNNLILEKNGSDMFITMFIGALNTKTGELRYSNAGHNPPVIIQNSTATFLKQQAHLPLGVMPNITYTNHTATINSNDLLMVYTDGLTEAENNEQELYSNSRMLELLSQDFKDRSARGVIDYIEESLHHFTKGCEQSDDITTMAIRLLPAPTEHLKLSNRLSELTRLTEFVEDIAQKHNLALPLQSKLNLALEEVIVNTIEYGYSEGVEDTVEIEFHKEGNTLCFTLTDSAKEFDPTKVAEADTTLPQEERPIGGLGILLLRKIMDSVDYQRNNNKNILTLKITIP